MNLSMFQFYSENSNLFNCLFLGAIFITVILISIYWYLSFRFYIKTKDNTIDPHLITELKAPSKIFYLLLISILGGMFFIFLEFFFANHKENLSSFKYMFLKNENVLFANSKNISHTMDIEIPISKIEILYVNNVEYSKFSNITYNYCQISFKLNQDESNKESVTKTNDLHNTFTLTIPKENIVNDLSCLEIAKKITYKINDYKHSLHLPTVGLLKTTESKPITYNENREKVMLIKSWGKFIIKPGSFFFVD